jgi:hypoxanthine phosphoribosyltransferase
MAATTKSVGTPQILADLTLDIANRDVLIIDDILDTGKTFVARDRTGEGNSNRRVSGVVVLLDKKARREVKFEADFVGFEIPNKFVVGLVWISPNAIATFRASAYSSPNYRL